jgi:Tol biopolymer transport system component
LVIAVVVGAAAAVSGSNGASSESGVIAFEGRGGLYTVRAGSGAPRHIQGTVPGDGNPRWSPDGKLLAFERFANDNWDLHVMNADGSGRRQLTFSPSDDDFAMWAPHGRSLVFTSERDKGTRKSIYVIRIATGAARRVTRDGKYPDWSKDGRIFFTGGGFGSQPVFTVRPYGSDRRQLGSLEALTVRVSHDGKKLVYQWGTPGNLYTADIEHPRARSPLPRLMNGKAIQTGRPTTAGSSTRVPFTEVAPMPFTSCSRTAGEELE